MILKKPLYPNSLIVYSIVLVVVSTFFKSHYFQSISLFLVFISTVWQFYTSKTPIFFLSPLWLFVGFYFLMLLSGIWGGFSAAYFQKISMKITILLVPLSFILIPKIKYSEQKRPFKVIISILFLSILIFMIHYILNFNKMNQLLIVGKTIWVPYAHHIRYSMLLFFGFCGVGAAILYNWENKYKIWLWAIWAILAGAIIVLSVRSGWIMLFVGFTSWMIFAIRLRRISMYWLIGCFFFIDLLAMAAWQLPSVRNKIQYSIYDQKQQTDNYSDRSRWNSIHQGREIAVKKWAFGWGEGNYQLQILAHHPSKEYHTVMMPHNQWVITLGSQGVVGVIILLLGMIALILESWTTKNYALWAYSIGMMAISMVEPILETQLGLILFFVPLCAFSKIEWRESVP